LNDIKGLDILIVDDEPHNIQVAKYVLDFHGADVTTCESGIACMKILETMKPDVVLLDIHMPKMTGYDVVAAIREEPQTQNLTVIALTALAMPGDYDRAMGAGFDGYITKPFDVATFVDQISMVLDQVS